MSTLNLGILALGIALGLALGLAILSRSRRREELAARFAEAMLKSHRIPASDFENAAAAIRVRSYRMADELMLTGQKS